MDPLLETRTCPGCGTTMEFQPCTGMLAFLNDIEAYCDPCAKKKMEIVERERHTVECRARFIDAQRQGLLTDQFRKASFAKSKPEVEAMNPEAWRMAREWRRTDNLYVYGHIGTGKTFLALCALRRAFVAGLDVAETPALRFVKTSDLYKDNNGLIQAWKRVDVLLLDDIDKARWNLDRIDALWDLLNARMSAGKRTIITGNTSLRDFAVMLVNRTGDGDRELRNTSRATAALDRLKPITQIELKGKSLR